MLSWSRQIFELFRSGAAGTCLDNDGNAMERPTRLPSSSLLIQKRSPRHEQIFRGSLDHRVKFVFMSLDLSEVLLDKILG